MGESGMKSQSAMEYLMTYGWAILIIAVVLGILYQIGIFGGTNFGNYATAGSCQVQRTTSGASLAGECQGLQPRFVEKFNGVGQISFGSSPTLQSSVFTIAAWVYPSSAVTGTGNAIVGSSSISGPEFRIQATNQLGLLKEDTTLIGTSTTTVQSGVWSFVAVTYDASGDYAFYINGAASGSGTNPQTFVWSNTILGNNPPGAEWFIGSIANVQLYNTTLSAAEVQALYQEGIGGAPIRAQNIVGWWPLNGNLNDYSGNNNDGQLTSGSISYSAAWQSGYTAP